MISNASRLFGLQKACKKATHKAAAISSYNEVDKFRDRSEERTASGNQDTTYGVLDDLKTAQEHYKRRLEIAKEMGDRYGEGNACGNLGNVLYRLGDFKTARDYHEHHLTVAKELGDRYREGNVYGDLGNAYYTVAHKGQRFYLKM